MPHVKFYRGDGYNGTLVDEYGFAPKSIDVFVDDGEHGRENQEQMLKIMWKTIKHGGFYIMEDVDA